MGSYQSQPDPLSNLKNIPKIKETELADGLNGNIQTIRMMTKIARERSGDPKVRKLALNILAFYNVPSHFYIDESIAIADYIKKKVRYVRDPDGIEYLQDPKDLIEQMEIANAQGDCDDMALLTATLLLSIGHQPKFRAVRYSKSFGNYNHIYVVDYENNKGSKRTRIVLDCILKDKQIGTEVPHLNGEEYDV